MQNQPATETLFRAVIMGAFVALVGWAACRYTTIPRLAIQKAISWYEQQAQRPLLASPIESHSPQSNSLAAAPGLFPGIANNPQPLPNRADTGGMASLIATEGPAAGFPGRQLDYQVPAASPEAMHGPVNVRVAIEQRLRALGAVYFLLESWGRDEALYRFHCQVALAGGAEATRSFEATGSSPDEAMTAVLQQVEAWRARVNDSAW